MCKTCGCSAKKEKPAPKDEKKGGAKDEKKTGAPKGK